MSPRSDDSPSIFVLKGSEPALVDRALVRLVAQLTSAAPLAEGPDAALSPELEAPLDADQSSGEATLSVAVEEHRVPPPQSSDEGVIGMVTDALFTPGFLAERRIVVLRDAENLDASQAGELATRLSEPFAPNLLVLTVVGKSLPAALGKIVKARGLETDTSPGSGKARSHWWSEQLQLAPVHLEPAARQLLERHLGEDVSRLHALLDVLAAAYGDGARVSESELEPFLGQEGGAPPWDLTDALDKGDVAAAVAVAHRLLDSGGRHPFQLLATLHRHFGSMLRLDGTGITDPSEAASLLAMAPYPARKVLDQARRLGSERVARAVSLIAGADLDLRGVLDWPEELVIEVLVARLAQLSRSRSSTASPASSRGR